VDGHRSGRDSQAGDPAADGERVDHLTEGRLRAAHLQAHGEAVLDAEPGHDGAQIVVDDVDRVNVDHPRRQLETAIVDVVDDDAPGADVARDRGGHDADRTGPGDEHVFAAEIE